MSPRNTTLALRLHRETIEDIAAHVVGDDHRRRLASGYVLCRSSRIFRAPNGSFTGRFAYRHGDDRRSIVETVPGLRLVAEVTTAELRAGWLRLEVVAISDPGGPASGPPNAEVRQAAGFQDAEGRPAGLPGPPG